MNSCSCSAKESTGDRPRSIQAKEALGESPSPAELQAESICTSESGEECQPGTRLVRPRYLAVDNSGDLSAGDVYVEYYSDLEYHEDEVHVAKFDSAGTSRSPLRQAMAKSTLHGFPARLAVDPNGDLFSRRGLGIRSIRLAYSQFSPSRRGRVVFGQDEDVYAAPENAVHEFGPTGTDLGRLTGPGFTGPPTALASDLSNGQLYVADAGAPIRHYDAACEASDAPCTATDSFGSPGLGKATGLAVDESSEVVYAADPANHRVDVFTPTPIPSRPHATTTHPWPDRPPPPLYSVPSIPPPPEK